MAERVDVETLKGVIERRAPSAAPLDRLRAAVAVTDELREVGEQLLDEFVANARGAGSSWADIGGVLGVSKQAAQQRFVAAGVAGDLWPAGPTGAVHVALAAAQDHARRLGHNYLGTEHLLLGLLSQRRGPAAQTLANLGVTAEAVLSHTREIVGVGCAPTPVSCALTPRTKRAIELAQAEARRLGGGGCEADAEHLLLALVALKDGLAANILGRLGATPARVREELARALGVDVAELAPVRRRRRRMLQRL